MSALPTPGRSTGAHPAGHSERTSGARQGARGPNVQRPGDIMLTLLASAGMSGPSAREALRVLIVYTMAPMNRPPSSPPERLLAAVDSLDVQPGDQILEIGCGRGVAVALICRQLVGGRLLALDRSAKAIAAATARNAGAVAAGKAQFVTTALEDIDPAVLGQYDKVFAINVNLFWVRPAQRELQLIADLLRPGGQLLLFYEPPDAEQLARLETTLVDHLEQAGFCCTTTTRATPSSTLLAVTAQSAGTAR